MSWQGGNAGISKPGYCACCREFHLVALYSSELLAQPVLVCQYCAAQGEDNVIWRAAGVTQDQDNEIVNAPYIVTKISRRDRELAESFFRDEALAFSEKHGLMDRVHMFLRYVNLR
jgi:hypothetical protein